MYADESSETSRGGMDAHVRGVGRGTAATILTRVVDVGATYGFYAVLARSLAAADFGRYVLAVTLLQLGATIGRRGLDQAILAEAPSGAANRFATAGVLSSSLPLALIGAAVLRFSGHPEYQFGFWFLLMLPVAAVAQVIIAALRTLGDVTLAAVTESVVQPVFGFLFALLALHYSPTLPAFGLALFLSWAVTLLFAARLKWSGPSLTPEASSQFRRTGSSMLGVSLLQQASASVDVVLLSALASATEVAHYAVAQKIAAAFLLLHGAMTSATTPFIRRLSADRLHLSAFHRMVTRWSISAALPLLVVTIGVPDLLLRLFGAEYEQSSPLPLALLSCAAAAYLFSGPGGSVLLCTGNAGTLLRISAAGTIMLILSIAALAPLGAIGASIGVLIGAVLARGLILMTLRRLLSIPPIDVGLLIIVAGGAAGAAIAHVTFATLGEIAAAVVGASISIIIALAVLRAEGDLNFLRSEMGR